MLASATVDELRCVRRVCRQVPTPPQPMQLDASERVSCGGRNEQGLVVRLLSLCPETTRRARPHNTAGAHARQVGSPNNRVPTPARPAVAASEGSRLATQTSGKAAARDSPISCSMRDIFFENSDMVDSSPTRPGLLSERVGTGTG